jgi:hypothetical protein
MQLHMLYTVSLPFSDSALLRFPCSSFVHRTDGLFGFGVSINPDALEANSRVDCRIFLCDLLNNQVVMQNVMLPYQELLRLQMIYDDKQATWILASDARIQMDPLQPTRRVVDLYEILPTGETDWRHLLRIAGSPKTFEERGFIALWQKGGHSLGLMHGYSLGGGPSTAAYWMQWSAPHIPWQKKIGEGLFFRFYGFDETFLLFTCAYQSKLQQWQWKIAAYAPDGSRLSQKLVRGVAYPTRQEPWYYAADDFHKWLEPTLCVTAGPSNQAKPTCVAALFLKDQPKKPLEKQQDFAEALHPLPAALGGLYWIDDHGKIGAYEPCLLGNEISMCLCGEKVIGTDLLEKQRRLWSWSPLEKGTLAIQSTFPQQVQRVTLIAGDEKDQQQEPSFWCVEEYAEGLRITLWSSSTMQMQQEIWVDGMTLLARRPESSLEWQASGLAAYQRMLLIAGLNREKHLQVVKIQPE